MQSAINNLFDRYYKQQTYVLLLLNFMTIITLYIYFVIFLFTSSSNLLTYKILMSLGFVILGIVGWLLQFFLWGFVQDMYIRLGHVYNYTEDYYNYSQSSSCCGINHDRYIDFVVSFLTILFTMSILYVFVLPNYQCGFLCYFISLYLLILLIPLIIRFIFVVVYMIIHGCA